MSHEQIRRALQQFCLFEGELIRIVFPNIDNSIVDGHLETVFDSSYSAANGSGDLWIAVAMVWLMNKHNIYLHTAEGPKFLGMDEESNLDRLQEVANHDFPVGNIYLSRDPRKEHFNYFVDPNDCDGFDSEVDEFIAELWDESGLRPTEAISAEEQELRVAELMAELGLSKQEARGML